MSYIYSYKECLLHPLEFLSWRQRQVICKWLVKNWEQLHSEWAHVEDTEACQTIDAHVNTEERTGQELLQLLWILTFLSHTWLTQSRWHLSLCVCVQKKRTYVWMCLMFNFYTISLSHTHTHTHTHAHNGNQLLWLMKLQIVYVLSRDSELILQSCVPALVPSPFCFYLPRYHTWGATASAFVQDSS